MVDVYTIVSDRIIAALDSDTIPWRKPWKGGAAEWPRNATTGRQYNGVNVWLLSLSSYSDPRWLTYKQASALGGTVRRGERGTTIIFWNFITRTAENGKDKQTAFLRYYTVFNVEQCEGLPEAKLAALAPTVELQPVELLAIAEAVVSGYPKAPRISVVLSDRAFYRPSEDAITVPKPEQFVSSGEYYSTLFHELTHSTGHSTRLARREEGAANHFGSEAYSKEELVAEFGSAFLCATVGIDNTLANSTAYIQGWLKKLRSDPKLVVYAASQAAHAADWILNKQAAQETDEVAA